MTTTNDFGEHTHFVRENTHNTTRTICWNARPCHRIATCRFCWNRFRAFVNHQVVEHGCEHGWDTFTTISFLDWRESSSTGLIFLGGLRAKLHRALRETGTTYLSVIAVGQSGTMTPHFHLVYRTDAGLAKLGINFREVLEHAAIEQEMRVHVKRFNTDATILKKISGYLLDRNVKPALEYRPRRCRLLTASRSIYLGRPRPQNQSSFTAQEIA